MPPILYLIDGHALAYRTYFALTAAGGGERLQTSSGEPTAGLYGFTSVLLRLLEQEQPEYLAVTFDGGHSFRDQVFEGYKATRAKMPDDLRTQMPRIRQLIDSAGIPRLEIDGYEADDILGSIARQAASKDFGVKIITGDRDLLQLVDNRIIVNLAGNKLSEAKNYSAADVVAYLGVRPDQIVDYKALVGDTSDNIPGVAGIGEKTTTQLLAQYDTLDNIYAHIAEVAPRFRAKLEAGRDSAYMSRQLATILTDLPITLDIESARTSKLDFAALEAFFQEMEFRTLLNRLRELRRTSRGEAAPAAAPTGQLSLFAAPANAPEAGESAPAYDLDVVIVDTQAALDELTQALAAAPLFSFDTETTSTDPLRAQLVGISLAVKEGQGYYIPVGHAGGEPQLALPSVRAALQPAFIDPNKQRVGQNLKYDALVLQQHGFEVGRLDFDTMIAEWVANPASRNLGLKEMAERYLGARMTHIEELIGKGKNQRTMAEVAVAQAAPYAAADAEICLRLLPILKKNLDDGVSEKIFSEIEMPLIPVLMEMESNGIRLDVPFFAEMAADLDGKLREAERLIYNQAGYELNLNSTQQLSKLLFDVLRLTPPDRRRKTSSGHYSTSADVLEELRGEHPVVDTILEYRELSKLKSTYVDALPTQVNPRTGRVHTSFNQTGSVTGRLASSDPNLQNIPTRTEAGRLVRNGFVASPGWTLLSVDYSQIELRIVAHVAQDEAMLDAFRAGQDIHATTAAAIYGIPLDQVDKSMRRHAKAINFGLIYGMSSFGLSRSTELTLGEAENFVKAYFQRFPGVKSFLDATRKSAAVEGYVETLLGRRRYFPNLKNQTNANLRNREEREAINAPIQGAAADIMKLAMLHLPPALRASGSQARLLLQVHDELVLETPPAELQAVARLVQDVMENAYKLSIPLTTEARSGEKWGELRVLTL